MPHAPILLTRPRAQSERFAERVAERLGAGTVVISPLLDIRFRRDPPRLAGYAGVVLSSARTLELPGMVWPRGLPAWCVGPATAAAARAAGLHPRAVAATAEALAGQIVAARPAGRLLHMGGAELAFDLVAALAAAGIAADRAVVYDQPLTGLSAEALALLAGTVPVLVPVFSRRTAEALLPALLRARAPLCLAAISPAVADALAVQGAHTIDVADRPDAEAVLDRIAMQQSGLSSLSGGGRQASFSPGGDPSDGLREGDADLSTNHKKDGRQTPQTSDDQAAKEAPATVEEAVIVDEAKTDDIAPEAQPEAAEDVPAEETTAGIPEGRAMAGVHPAAVRPAPAPAAAPVAPAPAPRAAGGVLPTVFGGVLAAVIGFAAAQFIKVDWLHFQGIGGTGGDPVAAALDKQAQEIAGLSAQLQQAQAGGGAALTAKLADLDQQLKALAAAAGSTATTDAVKAALSDYDRKLDQLGQTVQGMQGSVGQIASDAKDQMSAIQQEAEKQLQQMQANTTEQIQKAEAQAKAAADRAVAKAAAGQLQAALSSGLPYASVIPQISAVASVPQVLADHAQTGIPTIEQLQSRFTPLAREALKVSVKSDMGDGAGSRIMAFLKSETNVRSLTPKEGDGPDAVLSRAQAALDKGDLATATAELAKLPDAGQTVFAGWVSDARARAAADDAVAELTANMTQN